jgi:ABC-2 type transport system permease protein
MKSTLSNHIRIIWAIASKDIVDAIKNKIVLGIIIGVLFMMLSSQALPLIMKNNAEPRAFFYQAGKSTIIKEIIRSREIDFFQTESLNALEDAVGQSAIPVLGLIIPEDFDDLLVGNNPVILKSYKIHWAKTAEITPLIQHFEEELSNRTGSIIRIQLSEEYIYPDSESLGFTVMVITGLVLGVMITGLMLVPLLLIEEKESHTIDALWISPATTAHLLIGKSIAGMFFSCSAAAVMLTISWRWIVQWEIVILAVLLGALSTVAVGLLFGISFDNPTTVNLWVGLVIVVLLFPIFLWTSIVAKLTPPLTTLLQALPSVAMSNLIGMSLTNKFIFKDALVNSIIMILFSLVFLGLVSWRIRRIDR